MKKTTIYSILFFILFSISETSFSQIVTSRVDKKLTMDLSASAGLRYLQDAGDETKVGQYSIIIDGELDFNGRFQLVGRIETGNRGGDFNDLYNFQEQEFDFEDVIQLKRIYLNKDTKNGKHKIEAGAFGPRKTISETNAFSTHGWSDGGRFTTKTKFGDLYTTLSYMDPTQENLSNRLASYHLNYFEIALSKKLFEGLLAEGGVEVYNGITYLQAATRYDLKLAFDKIFNLVVEGKVQTSNGAVKLAVGFTDIFSSFVDKKLFKNLKVDLNVEHISKNFDSEMNELTSTMHSDYTGTVMVLKTRFPISEKAGINGFTNIRLGSPQDFRLETGFRKTIFDTKRRNKRKLAKKKHLDP